MPLRQSIRDDGGTNPIPPRDDNAKRKKPQFALRNYQSRIVSTALQQNTLVVLPTGAGKTLIGAELILRSGSPSVFLVPTVLLVEQQTIALRSWTGLEVKPFHGGLALPPNFEVLVSTPKAFEAAQNSGRVADMQWENLKVIVFDEVHHTLKEHPYRALALSLRKSGATPRVLGLTASYTYAVGEKKTTASLQRMCDELRLTKLETATQEELQSCGYHATEIKAEVHNAAVTGHVPEGVLPVEQRAPHLMMQTFFARFDGKTGTPFARLLTKCILSLERAAAERDPSFIAQLYLSKMKQWGLTARHHAELALAEDVRSLFWQLEHWYEALRLLIVSWEEDEYAVIVFLKMCNCNNTAAIETWPKSTSEALKDFWSRVPTKFRRLDDLKSVLLEKRECLENFRGIIFVQQRISTHILEHFIRTDPELKQLFSTTCLYAASTPATPSFRVTKSQAQSRIRAFASGAVDLLIATVVAEEGMDIPSANCVIRFDAMHHAVSLVQGRGRARQKNSSFVVLKERKDRPTERLMKAEKEQINLIRTFEPKPSEEVEEKARQAQASRERGAMKLLMESVNEANVLAKLNEFCTKTKAQREITYDARKETFVAQVSYCTALRNITSEGHGSSKKKALAKAAVELWQQLRDELIVEYV